MGNVRAGSDAPVDIDLVVEVHDRCINDAVERPH